MESSGLVRQHGVLMRLTLLLLTVVLSTACGKKADPESGSSSPPKPTEPVTPDPGKPAPKEPGAGHDVGATCESAVKHVHELMAKSGDDELAGRVTESEIAKQISQCKSENWPPELLACSAGETSVDGVADRCNKLAFAGEIDLKAGREFDGAVDNSAASPPVYELDGDTVIFNKSSRCAMAMKKRFGADAVFVMCGGKVIAGPLTTVTEIKSVMAEVQAESADASKLTQAIMNNYPSGCSTCRYRVFSSNGTLIREE